MHFDLRRVAHQIQGVIFAHKRRIRHLSAVAVQQAAAQLVEKQNVVGGRAQQNQIGFDGAPTRETLRSLERLRRQNQFVFGLADRHRFQTGVEILKRLAVDRDLIGFARFVLRQQQRQRCEVFRAIINFFAVVFQDDALNRAANFNRKNPELEVVEIRARSAVGLINVAAAPQPLQRAKPVIARLQNFVVGFLEEAARRVAIA